MWVVTALLWVSASPDVGVAGRFFVRVLCVSSMVWVVRPLAFPVVQVWLIRVVVIAFGVGSFHLGCLLLHWKLFHCICSWLDCILNGFIKLRSLVVAFGLIVDHCLVGCWLQLHRS